MKIRIKNNTIRLRLTQSEVACFADTGLVIGTAQFHPSMQFSYALQASSATEALAASFERERITVHVPKAIAQHWTSTEEVGFEAMMDNGTDEGLLLLVEKDFACMVDRPHEDEADNFPNPLAG